MSDSHEIEFVDLISSDEDSDNGCEIVTKETNFSSSASNHSESIRISPARSRVSMDRQSKERSMDENGTSSKEETSYIESSTSTVIEPSAIAAPIETMNLTPTKTTSNSFLQDRTPVSRTSIPINWKNFEKNKKERLILQKILNCISHFTPIGCLAMVFEDVGGQFFNSHSMMFELREKYKELPVEGKKLCELMSLASAIEAHMRKKIVLRQIESNYAQEKNILGLKKREFTMSVKKTKLPKKMDVESEKESNCSDEDFMSSQKTPVQVKKLSKNLNANFGKASRSDDFGSSPKIPSSQNKSKLIKSNDREELFVSTPAKKTPSKPSGQQQSGSSKQPSANLYPALPRAELSFSVQGNQTSPSNNQMQQQQQQQQSQPRKSKQQQQHHLLAADYSKGPSGGDVIVGPSERIDQFFFEEKIFEQVPPVHLPSFKLKTNKIKLYDGRFCEYCFKQYSGKRASTALVAHLHAHHQFEFRNAQKKYLPMAIKIAKPETQIALNEIRSETVGLADFQVLLDPRLNVLLDKKILEAEGKVIRSSTTKVNIRSNNSNSYRERKRKANCGLESDDETVVGGSLVKLKPETMNEEEKTVATPLVSNSCESVGLPLVKTFSSSSSVEIIPVVSAAAAAATIPALCETTTSGAAAVSVVCSDLLSLSSARASLATSASPSVVSVTESDRGGRLRDKNILNKDASVSYPGGLAGGGGVGGGGSGGGGGGGGLVIFPVLPRTGAPGATVPPPNQQQHVDRPYNSVISAASVNSQTTKMYWKMQHRNLINNQQAQAAAAAQAAPPTHNNNFRQVKLPLRSCSNINTGDNFNVQQTFYTPNFLMHQNEENQVYWSSQQQEAMMQLQMLQQQQQHIQQQQQQQGMTRLPPSYYRTPMMFGGGGIATPMVAAVLPNQQQQQPNVMIGQQQMGMMADGNQHQGFHVVGGRYQPVIRSTTTPDCKKVKETNKQQQQQQHMVMPGQQQQMMRQQRFIRPANVVQHQPGGQVPGGEPVMMIRQRFPMASALQQAAQIQQQKHAPMQPNMQGMQQQQQPMKVNQQQVQQQQAAQMQMQRQQQMMQQQQFAMQQPMQQQQQMQQQQLPPQHQIQQQQMQQLMQQNIQGQLNHQQQQQPQQQQPQGHFQPQQQQQTYGNNNRPMPQQQPQQQPMHHQPMQQQQQVYYHHQMNKKEEDIFPDDDYIFQTAGSTFVQQKEEENMFPDDNDVFLDDDDDILCMDMMQMQQFQQIQAQQVYPRNYYQNDDQNFTTTNSSSSGYAHTQYLQYEYPY